MQHLTFSERIAIETGIEKGMTFKAIAELINRNPTTVSNEVLTNRTPILSTYPWNNDCQFARTCRIKNICGSEVCVVRCSHCRSGFCHKYCSKYKQRGCKRTEQVPYVCNKCLARKECPHARYYYSARVAEAQSKKRLKDSRKGIHITGEELAKLDKLISRLIKKGQPLVHIYEEHKDEIPVCLRTLYMYVDRGLLSVKNIDLRRKTGYRPRKNGKALPAPGFINMDFRKGRTYEDYQRDIKKPERVVTEMDTVKGVREKGKRLLTMIMRKNSVMLMFLLPDGSADAVINVFNFLTEGLGLDCFRRLFPVFLTDNGSEFKKVDELELTVDYEVRTKIYYCDPMASWQKSHVEKNHEYIRYVIPKGKSLSGLNADNITTLMNHINSIKRKGLGNKSPYELISKDDVDMQRLMELMKMHFIRPDEVHLMPDLFKN